MVGQRVEGHHRHLRRANGGQVGGRFGVVAGGHRAQGQARSSPAATARATARLMVRDCRWRRFSNYLSWHVTFSARHPALAQGESGVVSRRHLIAVRPVGRRATLILQHTADILAFDIAVDPGHPAVDMGIQHMGGQFIDALGPRVLGRAGGFDMAQIARPHIAHQIADPFDVLFDTARNIAPRRRVVGADNG